MTEKIARIAEILSEVSGTHGVVFRIVQGEDPDWALWYAEQIIERTEFAQIVGQKPVRSQMVWLLVNLDSEYNENKPQESWPEYYAPRLLEYFGR